MPIDNGSSIWPKILTCKICQQPVERGSSKQFKVGERFYSCPKCEDWVPSVNTQWIPKADVGESGVQVDAKEQVRLAGL